ncbi:MAG: EAL domain-containing protein [Desulfovibrio sp.]|uniref:EAL domain-containing response regulator n=1 Tax=Desulfovibrio sp. 7SRBS1 TaxID=3378064 RepID=UPI003B3C2DB4
MNTSIVKHLLVVSVEAKFVKNITDILKPLVNVQWHSAEDIQTAWYVLNDEPIDLVLVDETLGDGSGAEFLQKIKWSEEFADTDCLLFFNQEDDTRIALAMELRASDYVVKPVTSDVLLYKLEKMFGPSIGEVAPAGREENTASTTDPVAGKEALESVPSEGSEADELRTFFQPILDIGQRRVCGFEALTKRVNSGGGGGDKSISGQLFAGLSDEETVALDRACRQKAMRSFAKINRSTSGFNLHLNVCKATIIAGDAEGGELRDVLEGADTFGISTRRIVLEIDEVGSIDNEILRRFLDIHRGHGFRIAFDRYDGESLYLAKVEEFRPDVVKLSTSLVSRTLVEESAALLVKALLGGALTQRIDVVATGVETEEQAIGLLELGPTCLQGFYFDRPHAKNVRGIEKYHFQVEYLVRKYVRHCVERIGEEKRRQVTAQALLQKVTAALARANVEKYPVVLKAALRRDKCIAGAFVIDKAGKQLIDAVSQERGEGCNFCPTPKGTRHFLRDYYLHVAAGYEKFVTPAHTSPFSGKLCRMIAQRIPGAARNIVCLELMLGE